MCNVTDISNRMIKPAAQQPLNPQQRIRVIGIGSHHGADLTGWLACERLQTIAGTKHFDWQFCRTPAQLPHLLADCHAVVIVDAVLNDKPAGQVVSLSWPVQHDRYHSLCSSHGINVIEALQLVSTLGMLPPQTHLLGLTVTDQHQDATTVVIKALPQLQQELNRIVNRVASVECCNL